MSDKLLPCPFCGSTVLLEEYMRRNHPWQPSRHIVQCEGCWCIVYGDSETKESARVAWNRRAKAADSAPTASDTPSTHGGRADGEHTTLRDQFAMAVVSGLVVGCAGMLGREFSAYAAGGCNASIAERAYALADTMLVERDVK